jgi:hypothetical protein
LAPAVTGGGFIDVKNNGGHVAATQTGTGTIEIVKNGGVLTATNTGKGVMTIKSTATGAAAIAITHTGDEDVTY